jgi:hypothetical protein
MSRRIFNTLVLAVCMAVAVHMGANAAPAVGTGVSSQQQGMHQWQLPKGKLILINGSYQDVTTYKRSLTFYFESKPGEEWLHVPITDGNARHALTWFSISQGEQTVADAMVVMRANRVELVIAETRPRVAAPIAVHWYRFTEAGDEDTDGPAYSFKKVSATSYSTNTRLTVEQVLKQEVAARLKK